MGKLTLTRKAVYGFAASKFAFFNFRTASNRRLSSADGAFLKSLARLSNPQSNDGAAHDIKAYDQRLPLNLFARLHLPLALRLKNVLAAKQILQIAFLGVHHALSALLDPLIRALGSIVKRPEQFIPRHF